MNNLFIGHRGLLLLLVIIAGAGMLLACGGGGGDSGGSGGSKTTISGTVASGSPVKGVVIVNGASGKMAMGASDASGSYSVDVAGLKAPYFINAVGVSGGVPVKIFSVATGIGRTNVTPITGLILRNALQGADLDAALSDWGNRSAIINSVRLTEASGAIQTQLQTILTALGISGADFLGGAFSADHSGLDMLLDYIDITYVGDIATISVPLTGNSYTDDVSKYNDTTNTLPAVDLTQVSADLALIRAGWEALEALYSSSIPSESQLIAWANLYVADVFLDDGLTKSTFPAAWASGNEGPPAGILLDAGLNSSFTPADPGYSKGYKVDLLVSVPAYSYYETMPMTMVYNSTDSQWKWYGNQQWVLLGEAPLPTMVRYIDSFGSFDLTGFNIHLEDSAGYAYAKGVWSAVINGPGIYDGVVLELNPGTGSIDPYMSSSNLVALLDADINQITEGAQYRIRLCSELAMDLNAAPVPFNACSSNLQEYTESVAKPPLKTSEMVDGVFPTIIYPNTHVFSVLFANDPGDLLFSWAQPELNGGFVSHISGEFYDGTGMPYYGGVENDNISPFMTSALLDLREMGYSGFLPVRADLSIGGEDAYGRRFGVIWNVE